MRAWGAGGAVRPVWSAVRPALMAAQVCSVLVISLVSTASRLPPWYTAHALLVAAFVASMGATFAFSEPLLAVPERGIKNRVRYFSSLVGYSEVVTLVLLWLRAAGRWAGMWTHIGDLEGRLWGRGERHLPRLRSHTRAVTCVFLIVHIPQEASIVWRRLASVSSLYDLGQMTCSLCILLVFNVSAMLLVVLSDMLAECFRALTAKLQSASKKNGGQIPPGVVEDVRVLYNEVRRLTDALDDILGAILLVMLFADGLFICRFLLHWFTPSVHTLYAYLTVGIVTARFVFTIHTVSSVSSEWESTRSHLYRMSPHLCGKEVSRFILQVTTDQISLTALGIVPITKPLMLAVWAAILSYEIILVQFNKGN